MGVDKRMAEHKKKERIERDAWVRRDKGFTYDKFRQIRCYNCQGLGHVASNCSSENLNKREEKYYSSVIFVV